MKLIQGIIEGIIVGVIIIMLAICTHHALNHRQEEVKPVEQGLHCLKVFDVKTKFNLILACNEIDQ
jgi:hypothetical protein